MGPLVIQTFQHNRALVFDSGVGGLSVVEEIRKHLPDVSLDYVADDVFRPYGEKTVEALLERLPALISTLDIMLQPDVIIVACNTASTTALAAMREQVKTPIIGVVPAIKPAAEMSLTQKIAVLGTPGTVRRRYVDDLIERFASDCYVKLVGSLELVNLAERKLSGETIMLSDIQNETRRIFLNVDDQDIDIVVLACTHFPLLREEFEKIAGDTVRWIDSGSAIARRVEQVLSDVDRKAREVYPETAFLIGPDTHEKRAKAFRSFGFEKVVGLMP